MERTETISAALGADYVTIVALGDSITAVNHWTFGGLNYVGFLQHSLDGVGNCFPNGYTVINSGIGGDSLSDGLQRLERDVLRFSPQLTIISFGMNDSCNPDIASFRDNLRTMIDKIRQKGSSVLLRTPNPIINMENGTELLELSGIRYRVEEYAEAIVETAKSEGTWLVDHYSLWKKSMASKYRGEMMMLMGNCMHPNANGHRRFYHELAPVFGSERLFQFEWNHILDKEEN